ncbi:MAG: hypothetical protein JWM80_445 [Cyanobacteria bacterium RYN_339]|nr:hypothetical protein [Cyanobacteria bacterium RYN_339]
MRRVLPIVAASLLAACTLPPYTTPEQSFSVKYAMFVPSFTQGVPVPLLPAFDDKAAPSSTVPIPKEAKTFKLAALELNLKMKNTGPVPLRIKIFLDRSSVSETDLYAKPPLGGNPGGTIDLPRGGTEVVKVFPIDTTLLQEENLRLGYTFGSPGTTQSVTFQDSDQVNVAYSIKATAKLF